MPSWVYVMVPSVNIPSTSNKNSFKPFALGRQDRQTYPFSVDSCRFLAFSSKACVSSQSDGYLELPPLHVSSCVISSIYLMEFIVRRFLQKQPHGFSKVFSAGIPPGQGAWSWDRHREPFQVEGGLP